MGLLTLTMVALVVRTLLLLVPLPFLYRWHKQRQPFVNRVNKIPGPPTLPLFGNALDMIADPVTMFRIGMNELASFGPVVRVWILGKAQIIIRSAKDAEKILKDMTHHVKSDSYRYLDDWMGHGLLNLSGDKWRFFRKVLTPAFHFNILHEFLPTINKNACKFADCLAVEPKRSSQEGFNVLIPTSLCAIDIICESSMGTEINLQDYQNAAYVHHVDSAIKFLTKRYLTAWLRPDIFFQFSSTKRQLDFHLKYINDFSDKVINERREYLRELKENEKKNGTTGPRRKLAFLDLLLEAEMEGTEPITQKNVRDNTNTVIFGGYDTIATAMSWAMQVFGQYPEIQARAVEEQVTIFGDSGRAPTVADLTEMKYLERCFKETVRLYPSIPFLERAVLVDAKLDDYTIPAGCTVSFNGYLLHRDPEHWPDPEKFDPDRFLPQNSQGRHPYSYIPFSAGPRNCIGQKFAMMEAKSVLSTVLRRFRLEAVSPREDAIFEVGMVLRPKNGILIRIFDREDFPHLRVTEKLC